MSTIGESSLNPNKSLGDCEDVDNISQLPDELLLKVLLFLPTKVAVSTSILSKRWEFLWMWLPKLEYSSRDYSEDECARLQIQYDYSFYDVARLRDFIDCNLPLHRAPVIESFRLKLLNRPYQVNNVIISMWVLIVVSRCVRELNLNISCTRYPTGLPTSLYTCKSLVILKLKDMVHMGYVPRTASLPSLKTLSLRRVSYSDDMSLPKLLSICPVLENLYLERGDNFEDVSTFRVIVPSLLRRTLKITRRSGFEELVIDTPSLKYFKVTDYKGIYVIDIEKDSHSSDFKDTRKATRALPHGEGR